ncbi:hypothetical protein Y032_0117g650 [Ancylostoma ceylanicum]|uniref:Reverse transcriptase domain-containing protein n=1 Tax=Ancylostoma ceylanicum TaxID=53326 RepID=A0A016TC00_9BILA|nr:hypothetical protein Y032_0117g650 [Ancylostoma ceylanicum]
MGMSTLLAARTIGRPIGLLHDSIRVVERVNQPPNPRYHPRVTNQCGFNAKCGTTNAIHAASLLIGKNREKQKPLHLAFLDLEKAFDGDHHKVIYALRWHGFSDELIEWVRILYAYPRS